MKVYEDVYRNRIAAKKAGDKTTANALKLILNTTYGAQLNRFNDLYDPLMARSVCISGQLYLLELANHLYQDIPGLKVVALNTDGIMVEFDDSQYGAVSEIIQEWQDRTHFTLEEDKIQRLYQANVNNYIEVAEDGTVKIKGGYLVRGIAPAGAFNINNNAVIVAEAIKEYFVSGTPPENTIGACDDVSKFQQIAKAGAKYREAYHEVDGEKLPVQKVNRVYAAKDTRFGRIYKVKTENEMVARIEMLPEHCLIDNVGTVTIDQIDKQFYVDMARKRINDFLGIKPEKKGKKNMAAAKTQQTQQTPMTALQKLLKARVMFLESGAKKSGMNTEIEFLYFELKDIVPVATAIFSEVGLVPVVWMDKEMAYMDMINTDDREDKVTFSIPLAQWTGNRAVNPIQVVGATVTYYRRYLYQIALDIVEADEIDSKPQKALVEEPEKEAPRPPATPQERTEIKAELTAPEGQADALQLTQLKKTCKALKDAANGTERQGEVEEFLSKLAVATKGFKEITKDACAKVLTKIGAMMEEFKTSSPA